MASSLIVHDLWKAFGGVPVLKGVSFELQPGRLTSLAGENGAGKSTLMNIITGQLKADAGEVTINGSLLTRADPRTAKALGVGIVPQELAPYPDLLVYENIFVGRELRNKAGLLDRGRMIEEARKMLAVFGVDLDPRIKMNRLSVALTQIVEITKATTWGASVLLLDEPTSAIPEQEVDQLYSVVGLLKSQGVAMLYTTHRMDEMQQISDDVVVLRDGHLILNAPLADASEQTIVTAMIGRELGSLYPDKVLSTSREVGFSVENLVLPETIEPVSFAVRKGEILGLAGLVGAGRTEILEAISGIAPTTGAVISVEGTPIDVTKPRSAINAGIALVPEDRKGAGLVLTQSVQDNGSLPHIDSFSRSGWIGQNHVKEVVKKAVSSVNLKYKGLEQPTSTLSGGNQQKVVFARWLTVPAKVLLLDEPTRGVDVGARSEIYAIIRDLAASGLAVVLASSDMPELIGVSHRLLVIKDQTIAGELSGEELDTGDPQEKIFRLASGQLHLVGQ